MPYVELTGFCLKKLEMLQNTENIEKATGLEIAESGKIPCEASCCVPGTAHVLKGESNIPTRVMLGKSQTQPDGGEGCSVIATVIR